MKMSEVRLTSDASVNTAYLSLTKGDLVRVDYSVAVKDLQNVTVLVVDFSAAGQVLGIEFLNASQQLSD